MSYFEIKATCPRCGRRYFPALVDGIVQNVICHVCQEVVDRATPRLEGDPDVDPIEDDEDDDL